LEFCAEVIAEVAARRVMVNLRSGVFIGVGISISAKGGVRE
jgi:hypothetical protein